MKSFNDSSSCSCILSICNEGNQKVQLVWLDFEGQEQVYSVIDPGNSVSQDTFSTHAWQLRGEDGDPLLTYAARAEPSRGTSLHKHHWARVEAGHVRLSSLLGNILDNWEFSVPQEQLRRGMAYVGTAARLRVALNGALHGAPVKVGVVGGSVSWGHGASRMGETDWVSRVSAWLRTALPNASVVNACMPGQPSALMVLCLEQMLDDDVDVVFCEYLLNDGWRNTITDNDVVIDAERLVRRVLALPRRPAMVLLQLYSHGQTFAPDHDRWLPFHATAEDLDLALAQYYQLPVLSFRNTVWRPHLAGTPGFQWSDLMIQDSLHPNDSGHKLLADLVVFLVQQVAVDLALRPLSPLDAQAAAEALLPPMYVGNTVPSSPMCMQGESIKPFVVARDRFEWVVEGKPVPYTRKKMGYAGFEPGASMALSVDTRRGHPDPNATVALQLAYLRSYEHMGVGLATCVSGCTCEPVEFDGHQELRESQVYLVGLAVTQHANCTVRVVVTGKTRSAEHKVKISGVVISNVANDTRDFDFLKTEQTFFGAGEFMGVSEPYIPKDDQV